MSPLTPNTRTLYTTHLTPFLYTTYTYTYHIHLLTHTPYTIQASS